MRIIGLDLLKKLGAMLAIVILGSALLQKIFAEAEGLDSILRVEVLLLSPAAYIIREASRKRLRTPAHRARERTRFAPGRPEEG